MLTNYSLYKQRLYIPVSSSLQLFLKRLCIGCMILVAFVFIADVIHDASLDKSTAYLVAQDFVEGRLLRPSSAKFPPLSTQGIVVEYLGQHRYYISGYLDALNTFGNLQRSQYKCIIRYTGAGEWVYEKVTFE